MIYFDDIYSISDRIDAGAILNITRQILRDICNICVIGKFAMYSNAWAYPFEEIAGYGEDFWKSKKYMEIHDLKIIGPLVYPSAYPPVYASVYHPV